MILWSAFAGVLMGVLLNWLADFLPRFAADRTGRNPNVRSMRFSARGGDASSTTNRRAQFLTANIPPRDMYPRNAKPAMFASALANLLAAIIFRKNRRHSGARLDLAVELLMAFLFAFAWARDGWSPNFFLLTLVASFFILIALIDLKHRLILNVLVFPAMAATLLVRFLTPGTNFLAVVVGGAFGLGIFWLAAWLRPGELGYGDVKLATLIGLMLGFPNAVWALLIGVLAGGVAVIALVSTRQGNLQTRIPYAPFLCLGALSALVFAPVLTFR